MKLTRLRLIGFKSFVEPTDFLIEPGLTGVVGPNGCGKSNLVEALRTLRLIHYSAWIARRWDDPAFPAAWPHFGTDEYWQKETEDLEAQLALLRGEAVADEEEGEGEGKDFH